MCEIKLIKAYVNKEITKKNVSQAVIKIILLYKLLICICFQLTVYHCLTFFRGITFFGGIKTHCWPTTKMTIDEKRLIVQTKKKL